MKANSLATTGLIFFLLSFSLQACPCLADEWELSEVVVKEDRARESERIEGEELRENGATDLGEALQNVEGFWKVRKGAVANDIVLRGFQKNNLNVLIDGARIYGACPNRMDPPSFFVDLGEIERVEVYKGPFDLRHQGSLGGLVNIKTTSVGQGFHGRIGAGYGSFNRADVSGQASYGTDGVGILVGGTFQYAEPYEDGDGKKITELYPESSPNRYRLEERDERAYLVGDGWTKLSLAPRENHQFDVTYSRHEARDALYPYLLMDLMEDSSDLINAVYLIDDLGKVVSSIRLQAYWDQVRHDMTDENRCSSRRNPATCTGDLPERYSMKTHADTNTVGATAEGIVTLLGSTRIGVESYLTNWDATTTMFNPMAAAYLSQSSVPDVDTINIGGYVEHEQKLSTRFTLTAGIRVDHTRQTSGHDRSSLYQTFFPGAHTGAEDTYPSGNVQLSGLLAEDLSVFLGAGRTVSVPDASERFVAIQRMGTEDKPDRVGNPGLAPEKNSEVDLAMEYDHGLVRLETDLFYSYVEDFIVVRDVFRSERHARTAKNVDAELYGAEASLLARLPLHLYGRLGAAYTRARNETDDTDLSEIPPFQGRASLRYDDERLYGELEGVFADSQTKVDRFLDEPTTPGWGIANLRLGYRWKWLRVSANIFNLFDNQYVEHLSYQREVFRSGIRVPEPGRTFFVSVQAEF
jgi:iron complex outermembrane receptor protein